MDSYNFHFERMSNVDLHHLSLPVSRLSPAKSNSSIVDQLAHHQHGKGDSAYSSFSGGSTAPDYPSPFLPEDLQSNSFSHYADLKYVKSIYHPTQVLQSDSKTMDQLYRSVEAISQQYCNNTNTNVNHLNQNGTDSVHTNHKTFLKREMQLGSPAQSSYPHIRPPPIPARLDSFIATKNLENIHHHSSEFQLQQPQQKARPQIRQPHDLNALKSETANTDTDNSSFSSDPVYTVWRGSQQQQPQAQVPPSYRTHFQPNDQARVPLNPESLSLKENKAASEQQKPANNLSRSISRGTNQPEPLTPKKPLSSGGSNGDHHSKANSRYLESQCKKTHSAQDWLGSEPARAASPWGNAGQSLIGSSSIQHKGQYYFVTGVWKLSESGLRTHSLSVCESEAGSDVSTVLETHKLRERCHSTMDDLFRPLQESSCSSSGIIPDEKEVFTSITQGKDFISRGLDQENHRPSLKLTQSSQSFGTLEEINSMQNREIGRHTASNPIFYCGPDRNCSPQSTTPTKEVTSLISNEQSSHHKRDDHAKRGKWQPLGDVASERINKETTPLLYHLTGANRAALQPKNGPGLNIKGKEIVLNKTGQGDAPVNDTETPPQGNISKNNRGDDISVACNTLDDSFKKYYKEKLKDAQSKVLRETSFKRKDLQLSWPNRIRQKPELRPAVIHCFSSSQDSETSTDTLTPSVTSEGMDKGSIKGEDISDQTKMDKKTENENGRPINVAQPQVARIRGRKRLTPEQKKMCYSEPEKLNQIGGAPNHAACRSFGNENDDLFAVQYEGEEQMPREEQGLVEARRKMFETRGRALSASNVLKTNLKHLRHQALVEYMERKTGQKVAEPQQPAPQLPPPPRQRHSLGEKPFDWLGSRPLPGNHEVKNTKKKLNRPHSAGRILDSSTSSIRYAQFFSAQSCSGQYAGQQNQSRWRESQGPSQGKSASAENLLDQPEQPSFLRNRSTSTPHEFQANDYEENLLLAITMETSSSLKNGLQESMGKPAPVDHKQVRVVSQRGKSMEELGASQLTKLPALSKSSEQLDRLWRYSSEKGGSDRDKRSISNFAGERETQGQESKRKKQSVSEQTGKEPEIVGQKHTQGQPQNQTQRKSLLKQNSESREDATVRSRNSSGSISPVALSSSQVKVHPATPGSHGPVTDEFRSSKPPSEASSNPPSPRGGLEVTQIMKREIKSTLSTPTQTKIPCENKSSSSRGSTSSVTGSEREQSVDEPNSDGQPPDSNHEVSLSCGITTDPSLWILPSEKEMEEVVKNSPLTDSVFDSSSVPLKQMSETSVSPCTSVSEADISHQGEEEKNPEIEDENVGENQEMEERGTPEGEMQGQETPAERPKWEELVEAVVKADQSLARVLYPLANRKTALMLMEQLLSEDTLLMEEHYKKKQEQKAAESAETVEESDPSLRPSASDNLKSESTELQSEADITEKKRLLVSYIEARLRSLEEMRGALLVEVQENTARGEALQVLVREHCLPVELERYNLFIGDLDRVVSLLLCLSARLARVQNALTTVDQNTDAEEKQSLDSRHRLLCKQREDAKDLKDNLDRRENLVSTFLSRRLSAEQLQNYRCFVQTKASLLIRQKDLEEKQRLGEEQLEALTSSLDL